MRLKSLRRPYPLNNRQTLTQTCPEKLPCQHPAEPDGRGEDRSAALYTLSIQPNYAQNSDISSAEIPARPGESSCARLTRPFYGSRSDLMFQFVHKSFEMTRSNRVSAA